ncbi:ABC transporter ATP-binding protein [Leptotrichia sp. oral taxon 221]|jgi:ABC transporter related|uniref:ABC transporter ATP-binding protein n=1 Tax=Leptotrichia sp. oral taxon 221 TaxID=712362 RepID=UPI001B8AB6D8|nr:ABC transporter ATP-binding protein [Leptotrichia sp. oral taxon 221]QUB96571.1 ABC transporter ATP-binding protein [Leptotrichia sp. oral taxon 221]
MNKKILELKNVSKTYKTKAEEIHVLKNINLTFNSGDFVSIQGKSGSGKTSLLNILGLLDVPTSGDVFIDEKKVNMKDEKLKNILRNRKIGFVFQFHYLLNEFTALENVMMPALVNKSMTKDKAKKRAKELLKMVDLGHRINHKPNELSGGEKQRVAIARAMINNPEMILADEPTGNLDTETSNVINELFKKISKEENQAIIIVTHSLELANMATYKYKIENGEFNMILPTLSTY